MSLIRTRQKRKKAWIAARSGMPVRKLIVFLALTVALIWMASNGTLTSILESF